MSASGISQRQLFLQHLAQTSPAPLALEIERAEGIYLYDTAGKAYIDLIAGIGPSVLGHRYPAVQQAVQAQLDRYWHTLVYGEYILAPQVQLATLLAEQLPGLDAVYFVSAGAEATEGAMKLAKRYTGKPNFLACRNAYHGSTQGAASLMSPDYFTRPFHPLLPGIGHIDFNSYESLEKIDCATAAVIVETVQGEAGIIMPDAAWLQALRQRCTDAGALLIFDEIQAGMGRTGALFAFQQYGVVPDILLLGKALGGGLPLAAFIAPQAIMRSLSENPVLGHITTYGGNPVCAAAGLATLSTLLQSNLIEEAREKGTYFRNLLQHPAIREIRGVALWMAVDLDDPHRVQATIKYCIEAGLVTDWFLFNDRSLRIAPPLTITYGEIAAAAAILIEGIDRAAK